MDNGKLQGYFNMRRSKRQWVRLFCGLTGCGKVYRFDVENSSAFFGFFMDTTALWKAVLADLELDVSRSYFKLWLKPTTLVGINEVDERRRIVTVGCRTPFQQTQVESRYYGQIKLALDRLTEKQNELVFQLLPQDATTSEVMGPLFEQRQSREDGDYEEALRRVRLRRDYVFDTFAVSSTNEMAHAAASAVARNPGKAYHLLYLYGGVGVGKTHLMSAIGHEILRMDTEVEMLLCSGEEFMNELVQAIQTKQTTAFKSKYRKVKVLLIDDIQFIAGKDAVQEEFFHTFNAIVQNQGQIVLTSDKPPGEMVLLEDRLRSRFEGGLTIDIQEPNLELRTAILNIKAIARGLTVPMDVAQLIAAHTLSTRGLEGVLVKLMNRQQVRNEPITMEMAQGILGSQTDTEKPKKYVPPQEIIEAVAVHFGLKVAHIKGKRRTKDLATARHIAMYIMRIDFEIPLAEVGKIFGGRDHTTVMHAVEKINELTHTSEWWRREVAASRKQLWG